MNHSSTIAIILICVMLYLTVVAQVVACAIFLFAAICFALAVWKTQRRVEEEVVRMRTNQDRFYQDQDYHASEDAGHAASARSYSSYSVEEDDASSYFSDTPYRDHNTVFLDVEFDV